MAKFILWFASLVFIGYGFACLIDPNIPTAYIGYEMTRADAVIETRAMYGGLELGFGLFCLLAVFQIRFQEAGLISIVLVVGGLAVGRTIGLLFTTEPATIYSWGAVVLESFMTLTAFVTLNKEKYNLPDPHAAI